MLMLNILWFLFETVERETKKKLGSLMSMQWESPTYCHSTESPRLSPNQLLVIGECSREEGSLTWVVTVGGGSTRISNIHPSTEQVKHFLLMKISIGFNPMFSKSSRHSYTQSVMLYEVDMAYINF